MSSENIESTTSVDRIVHRLCAESRKYREIAKRESAAIALSAMSKADAYDHAVGIVIALSPVVASHMNADGTASDAEWKRILGDEK